MSSHKFISLLCWIFLCFASKIAITSSQIVIEGFYNTPEDDKILEANNIQQNGTIDDWEHVNVANVLSTFPLFQSTIVQFVIHTTTTLTTKIQTKTYRFDTIKFRNLSNTGTRNETIWLGSLKPMSRRKTNREMISWSTNRRQKYHPIGFASIYERSGRIYSATFTTDTTVYDIVYNTVLQIYNIRSQRWHDFRSEDGSKNNDKTVANITPRSSLMNVTFAVSNVLNPSKQSWFSIESTSSSERLHSRDLSQQLMNTTSVSNEFYFESSHNLQTVNDTSDIRNYDNNRSEERIRTLQSSGPVVVVDVLVIVSHRGMCEFATGIQGASCTNNVQNRNLITTRIKRVEAETNNAWKSINVTIRLVQILFLDVNGWDPRVNDFDLDHVSNSTEIEQWRKDVGADLVSVVGRKSVECGLAKFGQYTSITGQDCLAQYTMSHEIGHNFAADHNKENTDGSTSTFAFGYRRDGSYRTIMSSECDIVSCPRVPYFSSATVRLPDGRTLGSTTQNNLQQIFERAPIVAQYMNTVITYAPTKSPTWRPTSTPITKKPTFSPRPTKIPTSTPTGTPTITRYPSSMPSQSPSNVPTNKPTVFLSCQKSTCHGGYYNLMYRRYTRFGRQYCTTRCIPQIRIFLYETIFRFKCGRCKND